MPIYTVHEPPPRKRESATDPERFVFVRDGFRVWAFLLAPIWMLFNRLWVVLIGYLLLNAALTVALSLLGAPGWARGAVMALLALLVGLEAGTLQRWSLRKWKTVGTVSADNPESAERRFYDAWVRRIETAPVARPTPPSKPHSAPLGLQPETNDVLGLFPRPRSP